MNQNDLGSQDANTREHSNETGEHFQHDVCPKCDCASLPFEGVPDQALRSCPRCLHEWFEDLNSPPLTPQ